MIKVPGKQSKSTQYVIGGVVAVIILFMWISIPLMSNSSLDSSVSANPFKSKTADLGSLGDGYSSDAPGSPLNGSMIDNPATNGEMIASSLFQMGPSDTDTPGLEDASAAGGVSGGGFGGGPAGGGGGFGGGPAGFKGKGKLATMGSLGGGGGGSMSVGGGKSDKFFGASNAKADLTPLSNQNTKGPGADKKNASLAMLQNSEVKSAKAAQATSMVGARGGATGAFDSTKGKAGPLESAMETTSSGAGISGGGGSAASDLKKSDPRINNKPISLPKPEAKEDKSKDADEEFKKMLIQMLIQSLLGPIFSNMASSLFAPPATGGT